MTGSDPRKGARSLAQIEDDLLKAEAAFDDADKRLKDAERDRHAAIETINKHQLEFDNAIAELRRRSTTGSRWRLGLKPPEEALILRPEDITEEAGAANRPKLASVSEEFDRLKSLVESADNDRGHSPPGRSGSG